MKTFTDNAGRSWSITINVDAVRRTRTLVGVDLMGIVDGKLLEKLIADPVLLCDCIYALCKPQADQAKVSDEEFGRAMAGDAIDAATTALLEELVGFFPQGRRRVLAKALAKLKSLEAMATSHAEARLDSPELDQRLAAIIKNAMAPAVSGSSSSSLPASAASIPAP
jgi:hypothetical protein